MNKEAFDLLLSMVDTRTGKLSAERYYGGGGRAHNAPKPTGVATSVNAASQNLNRGARQTAGQAATAFAPVGNAARGAAGAVGSAVRGVYGAGQQARQNVAQGIIDTSRGVGTAVGNAYGAGQQARQNLSQGIASRAGQIADESRGIAGGIAGGARAVGNAAAGLGGSLVNEARGIRDAASSGLQAARQGVQSMRAGTNNALAGIRGGVDQMTANMQGRPATPAAAPQSYAQRGIPSSADLPPATPQPPQYFTDPRRDHKIDFARDLQRESVKSFDQLPADFQERFRQRVAGGSVRGASEQDAVASYNRHYAGTTNQLRALSQNPRTAYGTQPAPRQTFDQMARTSPSPGSLAASRLPAASPQAVASR